ncbi:hypothetical protein Bca4012_091615 [Brassica carinata]
MAEGVPSSVDLIGRFREERSHRDKNLTVKMKLFDAHCHLQDKRVIDKAPELISAALAVGVTNFAVNGTSEIGLDKSPLAAGIDYSDQLAVFRPQLELAKELNKPVAVHCIDAFDDLLEIMRSVGPFPAGVILHSFNGTAEVVPKLAELGAYFSLSGWFTYIDEKIAKNTLKSIPSDRFLLETDSPDGLPKSDESSEPTLNEPANIVAVLEYVSNLSNIKKEDLAELTYGNTNFLRLDVESDHIKKRESENLECVVHCAKKKIKETKIREEEVWLHLA